MATNVATLVATLVADTTKFNAGLSKAERETQSFGTKASQSMSKIGPAVAAAGAVAGAAVVGFAAKSVTAFADYEREMNNVFTLLPGMSEDAMDEMSDDVKEFSKEFGVLPEETVPALYQALSAGVPKDNVFAFMEDATKMAVGGSVELEEAVAGLTSVTNAYGLENLSTQEASDVFFTTVAKGVTTVGEMNASLSNVVPVAASMGVTFDEVGAALATMTAMGTPTAQATTQIRSAIVELGTQGTIAAGHFEAITGQTFPAFIEGGGTVQEALGHMQTRAGDLGLGIGDLAGSVEAKMALISLTSETGSQKFGENLDAMAEKTGATEGAFETMEGGLARTWDKIKANVSTALVDIGERLAPLIQGWSDAFLEILPGAIDFLIGAIERAVGFVQNFVRGAQAIVDWVKDLPGPIKTLVIAIGTIGTALLLLYANPVLAGLALVAGAVAFIGSKAGEADARVRDLEEALRDLEGGSIGDNVATEIKAIGDASPKTIRAMNNLGVSYDDIARQVRRGEGALGDWLRELMRTERPLGANIHDLQELEKAFGPLEEAYGNVARESAETMDQMQRDAREAHYETEQALLDSEAAYEQWESAVGLRMAMGGTYLGDFAVAHAEATGAVGESLDTSVADWDAWEAELGMSMEGMREQFFETSQGIVSVWDGATDQIELTTDEFMTNLKESVAQQAEFEALFTELGNKGMFGLQQALLDGGPGSIDVIRGIADDQTKAYEANFLLMEAAGNQISGLGQFDREAYSWAFSLGASMHNAWVDGFGVMRIHIPAVQATGRAQDIGIHWNAAGGVAMGPTVLQGLGEAGPEAIVPLDKWPELVRQSNGGGGGINVYVEGNLFGAADTDELVEILEDARRRQRLRGGAMI